MLNWPAKSPDPNIIEEVWNIIKRRVRSSRSTSLAQLKRTDCQHLVQHPGVGAGVIAAVIRAKGDLLESHKIRSVFFILFLIKKST